MIYALLGSPNIPAAQLVCPLTIMSEAKFNKAVEIVQSLPKEGPVKPSQDDQLYVSINATISLTISDDSPSSTRITSKVCCDLSDLFRVADNESQSHRRRCQYRPSWHPRFCWQGKVVRIQRHTISLFLIHPRRDAWKKVEGTSKEDAQTKYVEKLREASSHPSPHNATRDFNLLPSSDPREGRNRGVQEISS